MVTPRSISTFCNNITTYKKSDETQKTFIDDFVLIVVKGLFFLSKVENIWMKRFGL
jgi:hypothetical protein